MMFHESSYREYFEKKRDEEYTALLTLRGRFPTVKDEKHGLLLDDRTLLRFLRARKNHVDQAELMLNETLRYRENFGAGDVFTENYFQTIVVENATGKSYCRGFDIDGHLLIYLKPRYENTNNHEVSPTPYPKPNPENTKP